MTSTRPLPTVTDLNRPFFEGLLAEEIRLQECQRCGLVRYPIATVCPDCLSDEAVWKQLTGRGEVHSTVVFHQVYNQAFADEVPYNVSIVKLVEGPMVMTNVVGIEPARVRVGDEVSARFREIAPGTALLQFAPWSGS